MEEIRHMQLVILEIIKDIDKLCKENNIQYYLLGGSAIGAIRHQGFIPWDDDLDIILTNDQYEHFIHVCKEKLNKEKYSLQVGLIDWPLYYSKIRLKGTHLKEIEGYDAGYEKDGIYVDVFKFDNVSDNPVMACWQYFCGKYYLCYQLFTRTYKNASLIKKMMMFAAFPLKCKCLRDFVKYQVECLNGKETLRIGFFYGRTRWKSCVISRGLLGIPRYVPFEDTLLPVPEKYHEYLTQVFGDYMKFPPVEQRVGLHVLSIDFGKY